MWEAATRECLALVSLFSLEKWVKLLIDSVNLIDQSIDLYILLNSSLIVSFIYQCIEHVQYV